MSLIKMITDALVQKYNQPYRLHIHQVAQELDIHVRTLQNQRSRGVFPIPTFTTGRERYCLISDVAAHLAALADAGRHEHTTLQRRLGRIR